MPSIVASRRTVLKAGAALTILAATGAALPKRPRAQSAGTPCHSRTRALMGTFVTISVAHESPDFAEQAVALAFERMEELIPVYNRFDPSSPLSVLNDQGAVRGAPEELAALLRRAREYHSLTQGAFNPAVKPVLDLLAHTAARDPQVRVDRQDLLDRLDLVRLDALRLSPHSVVLERQGMGLTLDGLAKGRIVDAASQALRTMGARNHLVDAGGDIRTSGERADGRAWAVAVQNPEGGEYPDVIRMRDGAVATSGAYEIWFGGNRLVHHIVDPRTGRSPHALASATVRASSVAEADALSTALFVARPRQGLALIDSLPGVESLLLTPQGGRLASRGWDRLHS